MKNNKIVLIGGGSHCFSVIDTILQLDSYSEIAITDNNVSIGSEILGCPIVGNDDILPELYLNGFKEAFITVGSIESTQVRNRLAKTATEIGYSLPSIIDPSAIVSKYTKIGQGVYVGKKAVINAGAIIGDLSIINTGSIVEHRCEIGEFVHLAISSLVCGDSIIGSNSFVGANSIIIQSLNIGQNVVIGAGSIILKDVPNNQKVIGIWK